MGRCQVALETLLANCHKQKSLKQKSPAACDRAFAVRERGEPRY
jgi:hypothetical protein